MMRRLLPALSLALAAWCIAAPAAQAACTGLGSCSCSVSAPDISFGSYNPMDALPADSVSTVNVTCTATLVGLFLSYEIEIGPGGSGNQMARSMSQGGSNLSYNLYTDLLRTTVWGDGNGGSSSRTAGQLFSILLPWTSMYPVYGRLPAGQDVASGAYADTLSVTVIY